MTLTRFARRLGRDSRAITAIEFAILAPVMFLLIIGGIEFGHLMMVRMTLEGSLDQAARAAMADLNTSDNARSAAMQAYVVNHMSMYTPSEGGDLHIETVVYDSFGKSQSEPYEDTNKNGVYDPPGPGGATGEWYDDRNHNGVRDLVQPKAGKLGGPGDVVSYTATFSTGLYFTILEDLLGARNGFPVRSSFVRRNEPVARPTAS